MGGGGIGSFQACSSVDLGGGGRVRLPDTSWQTEATGVGQTECKGDMQREEGDAQSKI